MDALGQGLRRQVVTDLGRGAERDRIDGRDAASLIASASVRSFLPRLTNGLTYCGGINFTRWPIEPSRRPQ